MNWITPAEMHKLLIDDGDVDASDVTVDRIERLMDELVDEGVMRRSGDLYQLVDARAASEYIDEHT